MDHDSLQTVLLWSRQVSPVDAQVCFSDAECQLYPGWRQRGAAVAHDIFELVDPDHPPYPSFAVATRPDSGARHSGPVSVAVLRDEAPVDLTRIHCSVLYVGDHGALVGNEHSGLSSVDLAKGCWPLQIWADSTKPEQVGRVTFVVSTPSGAFHLADAEAAIEFCPVCGSGIRRWALPVYLRPDDGRQICKRVVMCSGGAHITWRWEDRPDDPTQVDEALRFVFQ